MQSLPELQCAFAAALIVGDEQPLPDCIVGASAMHAAAAIAVYRNNVFSNYRKALREDYAAVLGLVGEGFFHAACDAYIRLHPSPSGDLNDFGSAFATFLESWPPAAQLAYLPDVARLEWAMHLASNAAGSSAFNLASLAQLAPECVPKLRFDLHPSAQLIRSPYPVGSIWRVSTQSADADERVDLDAGEDCLLVIRREGSVAIEPLAPGEWAALHALWQGCDLEEAHNRAVAADCAFDLGPCLQRHVLAQTIVSFHLPERAP